MEEQESSAPNFIPKDLLDIICILERDERHHSYKILLLLLLCTPKNQLLTMTGRRCRETAKMSVVKA